MTLGQEFTAFATTLREEQDRLAEAALLLRECSLGATAIGTGITAHPKYRERIVDRVSSVTGFDLLPARDLIEATWDTGAFVQFSGVLKRLATKLSKISSDLRLLSSGPEAGLAEIRLPARQAGSSIMPGKVNPVIPELMNQIAFFAIGADLTVTIASEHGQLQLNAFEPAMAHAVLQSMRWLTNGSVALADLCVAGIEAGATTDRSLSATAQATVLVPLVGYPMAADLSREAQQTGVSAISLALGRGLIDDEQAASALAADTANLSGRSLSTG
jgi:aspartate ammonia-lyase